MASHILPNLLLLLALAVSRSAAGSATSPYLRPPPRETLSTPLADDADGATPQQVHISMVGTNKMRVMWITEDDALATVDYGLQEGKYGESSTGSTSTYTFSALYTSGKIHEAVIGPLDPDSIYYYRCSGNPAREFSFKTPPASLPIKFVVIGDLGQTGWTNSTLNHISQSNYDILLLPGDLSYADLNQPSWDSYARLVEPLASSRPWMVTKGNHEIETIPLIESTPFKPYNARYHMPYKESASPSNLFYSFDAAGGAVHVLMLGSYTDFDASSDQFKWLQADLAKLDRSKTKWLFTLIHAPWYNSNKAHQGDGEDMRKAMEETLYAARVDAVFAGHVHAYERFVPVYNSKKNQCGPLHITIGDGGNREGLANKYIDPQPSISLFKEASFGHGQLHVANGTHALWSWHRNDDDEAVVVDSVWITSLLSNPACHKKN
ncbi:probable purple acid phosphatase 20 [Dendrobium catenatum]|uniref:Purple acid phosphatase n=1 Tax=Dendrobium catenatum TaxID=906689 RepID=A0A2I0VXD4_9ASPA|nr:probable purple acid phosphatase 20 [Dendrobium catenatum]PKU68066.1 putative purple acid phosphatase 20 [Dendrobium catenatum]